MKYLTLFSLLLVLGCSKHDYPEFYPVEYVQVYSGGVPGSSPLGGDFLPYLHPLAQLPSGSNTILVGYIKYSEEYHKGVAYLVHENQILDSLVLSILDPPGDQWGEITQNITIYKINEVIEEKTGPAGTADLILEYEITNEGFELVAD